MKTFVAGFACGTLALIVAVLAFLNLGLVPIRADAPPSPWASHFLYAAVHAAVRHRAPAQQNPLPVDDNLLIAGGKLYLNDCVGCHGEPGQPPSEFGATFYPPAPQLPRSAPHYTEAEIFWIAKHGIRRTGMYAQGHSYSDQDLWRLAAFIRQMTHLTPRVLEAIQQRPSPPGISK